MSDFKWIPVKEQLPELPSEVTFRSSDFDGTIEGLKDYWTDWTGCDVYESKLLILSGAFGSDAPDGITFGYYQKQVFDDGRVECYFIGWLGEEVFRVDAWCYAPESYKREEKGHE